MAGGSFPVTKHRKILLYELMADIRQLDKVSTLWPTPATRKIDKSGQRQHPSKKSQDAEEDNHKQDNTEDGPGKNIDEYA